MAYPVEWPGLSFKKYRHYVHEWPHTFKKGPGNYIYCSIVSNNTWNPIYISETSDLSGPYDKHLKMQCIKRIGVTHIHAHTNNNGWQGRLDEKEDLIRNYKPICNDRWDHDG